MELSSRALQVLYWKLRWHFFWTNRDLFLTLTALAFIALTVFSGSRPRRAFRVSSILLVASIALFCLSFFLICVANYATSSFVMDLVESDILSISALWCRGGPIYHDPTAAERYSLLYGPILFVVYGLAFKLLGPNLVAVKVVVAMYVTAALAMIFGRLWRETSPLVTLAGMGAFALGLMYTDWPLPYMVRADPPLIFASALGLLGSRLHSPVRAAVVLGTALGMSVDIKIHGFVYLLPALGLLYQRHGSRTLAGVIAVSGLVAALPFLSLPNISLQLYVAWLREASKHGVAFHVTASVVTWETLLTLPCILAASALILSDRAQFTQFAKRNWPFIATSILAGSIILVPASKLGAGEHHLYPFIPVIAYTFGKLLNQIPASTVTTGWRWRALFSVSIAYTLVALSLGLPISLEYFKYVWSERGEAREILAEIEDLQTRYPATTFGMGYGRYDHIGPSLYRAALVLRGHPLILNATAMMDMQQAGMAIPGRTREAIRDGVTETWLIPAGQEPFSLNNIIYTQYDEHPREMPVFDPAFRDLFLKHYEHRERTPHFDVWVYRPDSSCGQSDPGSMINRPRSRVGTNPERQNNPGEIETTTRGEP